MDYLSHLANKRTELRRMLIMCRAVTMHQLRRLIWKREEAEWVAWDGETEYRVEVALQCRNAPRPIHQ